MSAILEVINVSKRFGGLTAVKDVSFSLQPGELTGVLGPNGAGKTTLFNLLTGFIAADTGSIRFEGTGITGTGALQDRQPRRCPDLSADATVSRHDRAGERRRGLPVAARTGGAQQGGPRA